MRDILSGRLTGPKHDIAVLNAGAALYVCGKAADIEDGIRLADEQITSGSATRTLEAFIAESNS